MHSTLPCKFFQSVESSNLEHVGTLILRYMVNNDHIKLYQPCGCVWARNIATFPFRGHVHGHPSWLSTVHFRATIHFPFSGLSRLTFNLFKTFDITDITESAPNVEISESLLIMSFHLYRITYTGKPK